MTPRLHIKNWEKFQHYKDRNPPWIKLHFELLTSRDWVSLDDASRVLAIACMLIASRNGGVIPDDPDYLKRVAYLNTDPDLTPLILCGFLEPLADASALQAPARPETYREDTEGKKEPPPIEAPPKEPANDKPTKPRSKRTQLPADWELTSADITYAQKKGYTILQIEHHGEHFSNYHWREKTTCFDWHRSFITWCLHDINRHGPPGTRQPKHGGADEGAGGFAATAARVAARMEGRGNGMGLPDEIRGGIHGAGERGDGQGIDRADNDTATAEDAGPGTDQAERADETPEGGPI